VGEGIMSTSHEADLAAFQRALLELLAEPLSPEEMMSRLRSDEVFAPYRDYIETFEPRFVEVAAALMKKWGVREAGTAVGYTAKRELHLEDS
jgi:hypothetical protein